MSENLSPKRYKEWWHRYWQDMPEYISENLMSYRILHVHFRNENDVKEFSHRIKQVITDKTRSIWYPEKKIKRHLKRYINDTTEKKTEIMPKYPIYVISKGRWESRLTVKALNVLRVPYFVVIEPQEYDQYSKVIDKKKIKVLPFSNLGQGSIPARNWVWEDSIKLGAERHWILDDNINGFYRLNRNERIKVRTPAIFRAAEDFVDRYTNIGISGFHYRFFIPDREKRPPFYFNTRVYSCILLKNDLPHRWRGRYNEDTDLSLRILKDGLCSVLFLAFLAGKTATMRMKGGNTDELYKDDGRLQMAESLVEQHSDVARVSWKYNRYQHHVDYSQFRNMKLSLKKGLKIKEGVNNYHMKLVEWPSLASRKKSNTRFTNEEESYGN